MDDFVSCGVNSLPFLYSCATNPVCGDCAIKSIIAIEGVTSKTLNDYQANYVTNAINELIAYPEADLPD